MDDAARKCYIWISRATTAATDKGDDNLVALLQSLDLSNIIEAANDPEVDHVDWNQAIKLFNDEFPIDNTPKEGVMSIFSLAMAAAAAEQDPSLSHELKVLEEAGNEACEIEGQWPMIKEQVVTDMAVKMGLE